MNIAKISIFSILLFIVLAQAIASDHPGGLESDAKAVIQRYFDALIQGDTADLRSLMGGDLIAKRSKLLDNPTYSTHLINTYGQARYKINSYNILGDDAVTVDVTITLSPDETINKRFLLKKAAESDMIAPRLLIYDETAMQ